MLDRLFKSKARVKLLSLFLLNPQSEYYGRQLARMTGLPQQNIWAELKSLEKLGLLQSRREANLRFFKVNTQFPIYEELRSIFLKTDAVGDFLREDLTAAGEIRAAFIYGSLAKGTDEAGSDIDLFILGDVDRTTLNRRFSSRESALGRNINYKVMSLAEYRKESAAGAPFLKRILSDAKIMIIGTEDDLRAA